MSVVETNRHLVEPSTAEWLDGPGLVEWLEDHGLTNVKLQVGRSYEKRIYDWKHGSQSVWTADRVLVLLGLHLSELPDDLWRCIGRKGKRISESVRTEAVRRVVELGESQKTVARELRISPKTVRLSVQAARATA